MVIFIDDKPVKIISKKKFQHLHGSDFDTIIDARLEQLNEKKLKGHVIVLNTSAATIEKFFRLLGAAKDFEYQSIVFIVDDKEAIEEQIKSYYRVVKAAGGVVFNHENKILMMHRLGKWDLPKGKRDDDEKSKDTAVREVAEECNITVVLGEKICTTWHTYAMGGSRILKRTKWYRMNCIDDSEMRPQLEEDIEELQWMDDKQIQKALLNSYSSIRFVFDELRKREKEL
ncbi:NUDIX hydrolase [Emticicia sp. BO119]|uniref:NUDIX hydrolase n=1 Tax=Emticicia sp. BO119 TaxID=2757768 RepID=UPI0015F02FF0|nr:NUDIX domain-containing protein [Emticicia sp. BO119]MBA4849561.1 NUDIX domain-containing protein [Emticicia sp. BO119]